MNTRYSSIDQAALQIHSGEQSDEEPLDRQPFKGGFPPVLDNIIMSYASGHDTEEWSNALVDRKKYDEKWVIKALALERKSQAWQLDIHKLTELLNIGYEAEVFTKEIYRKMVVDHHYILVTFLFTKGRQFAFHQSASAAYHFQNNHPELAQDLFMQMLMSNSVSLELKRLAADNLVLTTLSEATLPCLTQVGTWTEDVSYCPFYMRVFSIRLSPLLAAVFSFSPEIVEKVAEHQPHTIAKVIETLGIMRMQKKRDYYKHGLQPENILFTQESIAQASRIALQVFRTTEQPVAHKAFGKLFLQAIADAEDLSAVVEIYDDLQNTLTFSKKEANLLRRLNIFANANTYSSEKSACVSAIQTKALALIQQSPLPPNQLLNFLTELKQSDIFTIEHEQKGVTSSHRVELENMLKSLHRHMGIRPALAT